MGEFGSRLRCFVYYIPCNDHDGLLFAGFAVCFGKGFEDVDDARRHGVLLLLVLFFPLFSLFFFFYNCVVSSWSMVSTYL